MLLFLIQTVLKTTNNFIQALQWSAWRDKESKMENLRGGGAEKLRISSCKILNIGFISRRITFMIKPIAMEQYKQSLRHLKVLII